MLDQLCMELGILHKQTSPYHPQCNAQVEVFNGTMKHYLQNALQAPYLDWEELLPALRICYNTSVSKATRKTPFSLLFGMKARMPIFDLEEGVTYDESGEDSLKMLQVMRQQAEECNLEYKSEYEKQYNKKYETKSSSIAEGEWIMVENSHRTDPNPKLHKAFLGHILSDNLKSNTKIPIGVPYTVGKLRISSFDLCGDNIGLSVEYWIFGLLKTPSQKKLHTI